MFVTKTIDDYEVEASVIITESEIGDDNVINGTKKVTFVDVEDLTVYEDEVDITDQLSSNVLDSIKNELIDYYAGLSAGTSF